MCYIQWHIGCLLYISICGLGVCTENANSANVSCCITNKWVRKCRRGKLFKTAFCSRINLLNHKWHIILAWRRNILDRTEQQLRLSREGFSTAVYLCCLLGYDSPSLTFQSGDHNHTPELPSKCYGCPAWHGPQQIYGSLRVSGTFPRGLKKTERDVRQRTAPGFRHETRGNLLSGGALK